MHALLIQHGCEAALEVLLTDMEVQTKAELNKKAHNVMILCLGNKVLRERYWQGENTTETWVKFCVTQCQDIPELKRNLISLGTLEKRGMYRKIAVCKVKVINGSRVILSGIRRDNCVYSLDGHAMAGKSHRVSLDVGRHTTQGVIDYVQSDLWDPSQVESLGGKRSSSRLTHDQTSNPTSSTNTTPKCRNRKSSKQKVENSNLEENLPPVVTMADNRTMTELLRAPTEGYKDLLRACPHHSFTELHQLNTFYNALNPADQDSLNAAVGGNLLERSTQDVLTIIENKSKVRNSRSKLIASQVKACDTNSNSEIAKLTHAVNQQTNFMTTAMTVMLKQFQATPPPALVKAVKEICVTCGGAHQHCKCLAAGGNSFPEFRDHIQGYVSAATVNYNQGSGSLSSNTIANPKGELKAITTRSGLVTDGPTVPTPPKSITLEVDERVEETYTDSDLADKLKCKALADLGASINLMPLSVWKELGLPELIPTRMTLELANRAISTPAGIARDVFVQVGKFSFLADFVIVDYESDPRVPLILRRPFLRTARALIVVYGEEMILLDGDERLTLNMRHDTSSYSNQPQRESVNLINIFNVSNKDSSLKYSIDQKDLANLEDNFVDPIPEKFTDEHAPDYSSPLIFDVYDDDFLEVESDAENVYDDPFDSKGEKIKESKLLIDELDLPCDFLPHSEYDSFNSQDFSRVDALPSTNNEDKVFNPGVFIQEKPVKIITRVVQDKKLAISNASLVFEDFDPPFYEPIFFKEDPKAKMLLSFSSENEEKVFKPGIHTSEKVLSYFIPELSHQGYKMFTIDQIFKSPMKIFLFHYRKNTPILDVSLFHFNPP
nr:reverse transcriptase domain-containing protein [Tanacetum cinerariifolium]